MSVEQKNEVVKSVQNVSTNEEKATEMKPKELKSATNEKPSLSQSRRLITARQISKLAKGDNPIFLAIVRPVNEAPKMKN